MKTIDIKAESFPWQAKFVGALFVFAALFIMANLWWLSILLAIIALFLFTGHSGTIIDMGSKTYKEYNSYLYIKSGDVVPFNAVEKIFINSAIQKQKIYTAHTMNSATFTNVVYNAYLKFDDGKKIYLTSRKNKQELITTLQKVADFIGTDVTDSTRD